MLLVQSRWYCGKCRRSYIGAKDKLPLGEEPIKGGYRVFFKCPECGEEIPDVVAEQRVNPMCLGCKLLSQSCGGTTNQAWTGCVRRERI